MKGRIFLILILTVLLVVMLAITAGVALATVAPFHPGQPLFKAQDSAEHAYLDLLRDPEKRILYGLTILERRIAALDKVTGTPAEIDVLVSIYTEIDHTLALLQTAPTLSESALRATLTRDLDDLLARLDNLSHTPSASPQGFAGFRNSILALSLLARDATIPLTNLYEMAHSSFAPAGETQPTPGPGTPSPTLQVTIDPRMVLFPPGSPGAVHAFYPLTGAHALQQCQACHSQGMYAGTANLCSTCHAAVIPAGHYSGECSLCHTTTAWRPVNFNHLAANAVDCQSCHANKKPANHYNGQCSACHGTTAWLPANFNHLAAGAVNCESCHADKKPANHYNGQCSLCHATTAWRPATFNHQAMGAVNCESCHADKKPANHYNGQCSLCHATTAWRPATFNHQAMGAVDCQSCHANKKPANHFSGQCSSCHSTSAWRPASFNHQVAGAVDCVSCHSANKPANHYNGQCSSCHSTNAWRPASFNHAAAGATDCQSCHGRPANHFSGQCSQCHSTTAWTPANFNHTFPLNHGGANGTCATCHPGGGSAFTCFNCHNESEMTQKHNEKGISDYVSRCMECHWDGRKHDN